MHPPLERVTTSNFTQIKLLKGSSRWVIFLFGYAFKIPSFYSYERFLWGLLANLRENRYYRLLKSEKLCPIIFYLPFGLLNIMPKVEILNENEFKQFDALNFCLDNGNKIPAETKRDSYGKYCGKIVCVDYG